MDYRYYNYFTEIEEYFVRKRGKHLLISPLDWSLIESWKQLAIPLHIVFRGIDQAFESRSRRSDIQRINSIFYCQPAVMACFDEYQEAKVGEAPAAESGTQDSPERLLETLEDLQRQLGSVAATFPDIEAPERVEGILKDLLTEIRTGRQPAMAAVEDSLRGCDLILVEAARRQLSPAQIASLEKEVAQQLKIYKKRVSAEMYRRIRDNFLRRKIREHYGIPEFTLFSLK